MIEQIWAKKCDKCGVVIDIEKCYYRSYDLCMRCRNELKILEKKK